MASIVLLLSELLGGDSAGELAANRYVAGQSLGEFRPAVTAPPASSGKQDERRPAAHHATATAGTERDMKDDSFEDLVVARIAVDVMWP